MVSVFVDVPGEEKWELAICMSTTDKGALAANLSSPFLVPDLQHGHAMWLVSPFLLWTL